MADKDRKHHTRQAAKSMSEGPTMSEDQSVMSVLAPMQQQLASIQESLGNLLGKFDNVHKAIFDPVDGIEPRLTILQDETDDNTGKIVRLEAENKQLKFELDIIKGLLQKYADRFESIDRKLIDHATRSMKQNVVIYGIKDEDKESNQTCKQKVTDFFNDQMNLTGSFNDNDIWVAHRMGQRVGKRPMVAKVSYPLKELIFENLGNLRGKENEDGVKYFVNEQQPEALVEERKTVRAKAKELKEKNEDPDTPEIEKVKVEIKGGKLYVNNELERDKVKPPTPSDLFVNQAEQKRTNDVKLEVCGQQGEKGSSFYAYATEVDSIVGVRRAYRKVKQINPHVNHIMAAYKVIQNGTLQKGHCDDREHGGGRKILEEIGNRENVAVFVCRKFGGQHIGAKRFEHISQVAHNALTLLPP